MKEYKQYNIENVFKQLLEMSDLCLFTTQELEGKKKTEAEGMPSVTSSSPLSRS